MTFESELTSLDTERLAQAFSVLHAQARAGNMLSDMSSDEVEQKYARLNTLADTMRTALWEDAEAGLIAPANALAMTTGARIALLSLMQYSEAELFEQQMSPEQE